MVAAQEVVPHIPLPLPASLKDIMGANQIGYRDTLTYREELTRQSPFEIEFKCAHRALPHGCITLVEGAHSVLPVGPDRTFLPRGPTSRAGSGSKASGPAGPGSS